MKMMSVVEIMECNRRFGQNVEIGRRRFMELMGSMQGVDKNGGATNDTVSQAMEDLIPRRMLEVAEIKRMKTKPLVSNGRRTVGPYGGQDRGWYKQCCDFPA